MVAVQYIYIYIPYTIYSTQQENRSSAALCVSLTGSVDHTAPHHYYCCSLLCLCVSAAEYYALRKLLC